MNGYENDIGVFYKKILLPIDSSKPTSSSRLANHAFHMASLESQKANSEAPLVIVLNVIEDIKQGGAIGLQSKYGNMKLIEGFRDLRQESAKKWIFPVEEDGRRKGLNVKGVILYANGKSLADVIVDYAKNNQIDLIVIGAGDLFKMKYLLVGGSVAGKIIKKCNCPIMLIH